MHSKQQMIILASRSPRRVELLGQIGIECMVIPADIDETILAGESAQEYVLRLAQEKVIKVGKHLKSEYEHLPALAADTTVVLNGEILGKPLDDDDAFAMLKKLSGKRHEVHTAVAIKLGRSKKTMLSSTWVEMMPLTAATIKDYIASGEHRDKAGSYAIQGRAGAWIKRIEGSYSGVMGLPLYETAKLIHDITK